MNKVPQVRVGIMNEPTVDFVLNNQYQVNGNLVAGNQHVEAIDGKIVWNNQSYDELLFEFSLAQKRGAEFSRLAPLNSGKRTHHHRERPLG